MTRHSPSERGASCRFEYVAAREDVSAVRGMARLAQYFASTNCVDVGPGVSGISYPSRRAPGGLGGCSMSCSFKAKSFEDARQAPSCTRSVGILRKIIRATLTAICVCHSEPSLRRSWVVEDNPASVPVDTV